MQISDLKTLSTQEKLQAMEALWDSLCHEDATAVPSPDWHAKELTHRHTDWLNDGQPTKSLQSVKEKLRKINE